MNTLDKINTLLLAKHLAPITSTDLQLPAALGPDNNYRYATMTPVHDILDRVDSHCGIITRFKLNGDLALVGDRVRRLERHICLQDHPPYFHLGALADDLAHGSALS